MLSTSSSTTGPSRSVSGSPSASSGKQSRNFVAATANKRTARCLVSPKSWRTCTVNDESPCFGVNDASVIRRGSVMTSPTPGSITSSQAATTSTLPVVAAWNVTWARNVMSVSPRLRSSTPSSVRIGSAAGLRVACSIVIGLRRLSHGTRPSRAAFASAVGTGSRWVIRPARSGDDSSAATSWPGARPTAMRCVAPAVSALNDVVLAALDGQPGRSRVGPALVPECHRDHALTGRLLGDHRRADGEGVGEVRDAQAVGVVERVLPGGRRGKAEPRRRHGRPVGRA